MFGKMKNSLDKGVAAVSVKSGVFVETSKIKTYIANLQDEIVTLKKELADATYQMWINSTFDEDGLDRLCREIYSKEEEIANQERKIEEIINQSKQILGEKEKINKCSCGLINAPTANFCIECGKKIQ